MDTLITIGNFSIKWYSIFIIIGILLGYYGANKEAKKINIDQNFIFNLIFWTVIFGILGARLYYVIFNWEYYSQNLSEIYKVWNGGLAIHGGLLVGILVVFIYSKKYKQNTLRMYDIFAPFVILAQAIGRWGNFFNKEAYGSITSLETLQRFHVPSFIIEGMYINGNYYVPTFLVETIWCFLGFIFLLLIRRCKKIKVGQVFSIYLMWYSTGRFFIESYRTDSLLLGNYRMAQIVSILLFVIGFVVFIVSIKSNEKYNKQKGGK